MPTEFFVFHAAFTVTGGVYLVCDPNHTSGVQIELYLTPAYSRDSMSEAIAQKIETFFAGHKLRRYVKGQILILNGDETDYVYHMVRGKVKEYDVTYHGDEVILNVFKPPAFFPMSLAINKTPNPYVYEAETDIEIHQAPADEAVAFLKANPDVMFDLLSRLYKGVDGLLGRMAHLMAGSAKSRLLYELLIECRRFGDKQTDGGCLLAIKEIELAARAGLSRETVSREMRKLIADDVITVSRNGILVCNLDALEKKLGAEL